MQSYQKAWHTRSKRDSEIYQEKLSADYRARVADITPETRALMTIRNAGHKGPLRSVLKFSVIAADMIRVIRK